MRDEFTPTCVHCGGHMIKAKKGNGCLIEIFALILGSVGLFLCVTLIGLIPGLVLIVLALLVAPRAKKGLRCRECRAWVARG